MNLDITITKARSTHTPVSLDCPTHSGRNGESPWWGQQTLQMLIFLPGQSERNNNFAQENTLEHFFKETLKRGLHVIILFFIIEY